ncbi:MAG: LPP20 family lipoprotein [Deferribacteraceae bacterium]|jgi:hypothetical protein|nr:LPP20 family lipoprotein [Deferribacteraceae bacterium]
MRKYLICSLLFTFAMFIYGCGGSDAPVAEINNKCLEGSPDWVFGNAEGGLNSVGAAKISKAGINFARTAAMANARDEMARTIEVKTNNLLKDFTQVTGLGDTEVVDKVTASVSKQVSSQTLSGTVQKALWQSPCNELYVLISIDSGVIAESVKNSVASSYKNDAALWQQFQAAKAQDELDAAIRAEFPK